MVIILLAAIKHFWKSVDNLQQRVFRAAGEHFKGAKKRVKKQQCETPDSQND